MQRQGVSLGFKTKAQNKYWYSSATHFTSAHIDKAGIHHTSSCVL